MLERQDLNNRGYSELVFRNVTNHSQLVGPVVKGIVDCVLSSGMDTTNDDILNHISGDVVSVFQDPKTQNVIGFSSTSILPLQQVLDKTEYPDRIACYFVGATISKEHQGNGLYKRMNERRIGFAIENGLDLIVTRTQNPRVQSGIQSVLNDLKQQGVIYGYSLDRTLHPGCYGKMLTFEKPVDDKVSYDELDYEKGDAYMLFFTLQYNQPKDTQL